MTSGSAATSPYRRRVLLRKSLIMTVEDNQRAWRQVLRYLRRMEDSVRLDRECARNACDTYEALVESYFDDPVSRSVQAEEFEAFFEAWDRHQEKIAIWKEFNAEWLATSSAIMSLIVANPPLTR